MNLYYLILGATPKGRNTEQHDVFFGIAEEVKDLVPDIKDFWKEAEGNIHVDGFQKVDFVDGYRIKIALKSSSIQENKLFFINLGGYKKGVFAEFHEQHLMVGKSLGEVIKRVKATTFYKTMGFDSAVSHVDDKHGVDVDDIFEIHDILPSNMKEKYSIIIEETDEEVTPNNFEVGYFKLDKL